MRVEAALLCFKEQETRGAAGVGQVPGVVLLAMGDKACRTLCDTDAKIALMPLAVPWDSLDVHQTLPIQGFCSMILFTLWAVVSTQLAHKHEAQRKTERLQVISTLDKASASRIRLAMTTK